MAFRNGNKALMAALIGALINGSFCLATPTPSQTADLADSTVQVAEDIQMQQAFETIRQYRQSGDKSTRKQRKLHRRANDKTLILGGSEAFPL